MPQVRQLSTVQSNVVGVINLTKSTIATHGGQPTPIVFEAGNVDPNKPHLNCIQFWAWKDAEALTKKRPGLQTMKQEHAEMLLQKSLQLGSFFDALAVYKLRVLPSQKARFEQTRRAAMIKEIAKSVGEKPEQIQERVKDFTNKQLFAVVKNPLMELGIEADESVGAFKPDLEIPPDAFMDSPELKAAADAKSVEDAELGRLRAAITGLGGKAKPNAGLKALTAQLADLQTALHAQGAFDPRASLADALAGAGDQG